MTAARVRPEIEVGPIRPPQRLAPYSHAVGAEVLHPDSDVVAEQSEGDAFGRLILLFDPDGDEAWNGTMRWWRISRPISTKPSPRIHYFPK